MRSNRDLVIGYVFGDEKGFVNRPETDAGGATNMGITQKTLSAWRGRPCTVEDVRRLTRREAFDIYASEYWNPIRGDDLPSGLDYSLFDSCVTSGANRTGRILQQTLVDAGGKNVDGSPINVDGNIGKQTLYAISQYPGGTIALIRAFCEARMEFMRGLKGKKGFPSNGRGWTIRVTGVDPKGQWKSVPGVVGISVKMAMNSPMNPPHVEEIAALPAPVQDMAGAKTEDSATVTIPSILAKPEGIGGLIVSVTGLVTAVQGNTILSYALGASVFGGVLFAGFCFYRRLKRSHA